MCNFNKFTYDVDVMVMAGQHAWNETDVAAASHTVTAAQHGSGRHCKVLILHNRSHLLPSSLCGLNHDDEDESKIYVRPLLQLETVTSMLVIKSNQFITIAADNAGKLQ